MSAAPGTRGFPISSSVGRTGACFCVHINQEQNHTNSLFHGIDLIHYQYYISFKDVVCKYFDVSQMAGGKLVILIQPVNGIDH
jgi:hypothetical protein